jgi:hypothetical protein
MSKPTPLSLTKKTNSPLGEWACVFDGIGQEVGPYLAHKRRVGFDFRERGELPFDAAALNFRLKIIARTLQDIIHVHQLQPQFSPAHA